MLKTNSDKLVKISVVGQIDSSRFPSIPWMPHFISREGKPKLVPTNGGIVYNVRVGDLALGWVGEVLEPGVCIRNKDAAAHRALMVFACIGNEAVVMSGTAKGAKGTVTGKSGRFMEHIIIDFPSEVLDELAVGDTVLVKAFGRGAAIEEFPGVRVKNVAPDLLDQMGIIVADDKLRVPVSSVLPAELVGAGAGIDSDGGCLQIQIGAPGVIAEYGLQELCLGDIIVIQDYDSSYAPGFLRGAQSVGVVCHGDSNRAGFGPGVTIIMAALNGEIRPIEEPQANIARLLQLGAYR